MSINKNKLPEGPWIDKTTREPLPIFRDLLVLIDENSGVNSALSDDDTKRLSEIKQSLDVFETRSSHRVVDRVYSSGPVSGRYITITHNLGTRDVFYTLHKTSEGTTQSVQIIDENTVKVLTYSSPSTPSYQTIIIYTLK